ncbi:MAG: 16S rRNA (guanine(966)-N(2))-methyltransferase RsmD [Opitutaceae bacterium]|jgi:16S rRNA (guanine966-N2)-methyltransferase
MRISGGVARGIPLIVPKGEIVRPATDRLRQSVFSSLGARIAGARFLDLFAGSGAYGLEALSRGASGGVFVERNSKAIECLRRNLAAVCKSMKRDERTDIAIVPGDATAAPAFGAPPDLVFVDPPYELIETAAAPLFARLAELLALRPMALVVFEMPGACELSPAGWRNIKRLGKGARQPTAVFFAQEPR